MRKVDPRRNEVFRNIIMMFSPFTGTVSKKNDFYEVYVSTFIQPALITVYCFN